jgi:hypothetical protein
VAAGYEMFVMYTLGSIHYSVNWIVLLKVFLVVLGIVRAIRWGMSFGQPH